MSSKKKKVLENPGARELNSLAVDCNGGETDGSFRNRCVRVMSFCCVEVCVNDVIRSL